MSNRTGVLRLAALLVVGLAALGLASGVLAQEGEALPPHVIDVWPLPGVEIAPDEGLEVTFDQPMDRASVEAAFAFEPALDGAFTWADDSKTVAFLPAQGWPRAASFDVTIAASAAAQNGLTLPDAAIFEARTIGALVVSEVAPADGAEGVAADAVIVLSFNRPVVPLVSTEQLADLPTPITIEPAIAGEGEWVNTSIYRFTPSEALRGGTTYTVTVDPELTTVTGAALDGPFAWSFRTLPPQILNVSPAPGATNVLLESVVTVQFSQPMDRASVEAAFLLFIDGAGVEGAFGWNDDSTTLTFTPAAMLGIDRVYVVNVADTARSASGEATLDDGLTTSFSTVPLPGIESTSPRNGDAGVRPGYGATIYFRSPMNTDTFEGKASISPEPAEWLPQVYSSQALGLNFRALPNTTYTITFRAGAQDIYGNAIATDYTFQYSTGEINTYAYPVNSGFGITGAHRQDTRFPLMVSGTPTVEFWLFNVGPDYIEDALQSRYYGSDRPAWATPQNLVRNWRQAFDSQGVEGTPKEVLLASESGGTLPNGVYWLMMTDPRDPTRFYQFGLGVVTANLAVRRTPDEIMVWVTDMPSAAPVADTTVTVYHHRQAIARGGTGSDGVFRAPVDVPVNDTNLYIVVEGAGAYGVWNSYGAGQPTTSNSYLYTDRPIYRPAETVYYRGVLRARDDMTYSLPNLRSVFVTVNGADGQELFSGEVPVTDFGTFSGEFALPEEAAVGYGSIQARAGDHWASVNFQVAEFRVPEFLVTVTPEQDAIFQGDPLAALVQSSFYFGGAVSGAMVNWNAVASPTYFSYSGPGRYTFGDQPDYYGGYYEDFGYGGYYGGQAVLGSGSGSTDGDGRYLITLENTASQWPNRPMQITLEASITDESNQVISGRGSVIAHPANVYVGLRSDQYFGREGQPMDIGLIAVTAESEAVADKRIDLTLVEQRWTRVAVEGQFGRYTWEQEEIEVETATVRTGQDGTAVYRFTPPNAGIFFVRAASFDEYERPARSSLRFWVTGTQRVWWGEPTQTVDLIADKESYVPGEVAQILVPLPFAGGSTVLVTTERLGILSHEVIAVEGSTLLYELPITDDHAPNVFFTVTVVKGIDEESLNPEYRTGSLSLAVEPVRNLLTITITPSVATAQPRDTVSFDVQATDSDGNPVQAEFGLALTDKAILALAPDNAGTLQDRFYGGQGDYVRSGISLEALIDRLNDEVLGESERREADDSEEQLGFAADGVMMEAAGALAPSPTAQSTATAPPGEQPQQPVTVREDFQQTPLWQAHVVTDAEGRATVEVTLPDNLTTWQFDARALTVTTQVGQATDEIVATLPLLVRPATPRFMVVGDRVELAMVINNNTAEDQTVQATLEAAGVTLDEANTQTVVVPAQGRLRVAWMATVEDEPNADLTFIAIGENGAQDAARPSLATGPEGTIPIYRYTAPDTTGTGGILRESGAVTEAISLPPRLDTDQGELLVHLDPSLAVTTVDTLDYLENYPHQCIEQTVSRFLPNVITYRALRDLGINDPALEANLFEVLDYALNKLAAEQNPDGGWGWFYNMESNPLVTAYAALGLIEARQSGLSVDPTMIDRAINFVRTDYITPRIDTTPYRLNRQAFYFYVAARGGQATLGDFNALYEQRLEMSYMARAYLLLAYLEAFPSESTVQDLVSDLTSAAILSATGAHWEESWNDWWNWSSDTRTTAVVLKALVQAAPESSLLPNAVRWLMVARQGDHWQTTQETVWSLLALTDWMVLTGELQGQYSYTALLNRETVASGEVTPDTVREGQVIRIAVRDLLQDEANRFIVQRGEGPGALYYTAHLNLRLFAEDVDAINRGIGVQREYFREDDADLATPVTGAAVGDVLTVRLTLTLSEDIYYFVLEDPIPAGTEAVDTSLLTTSQLSEQPTLRRGDRRYDPRWYWGWWWFDRTELRDEEARLYADFLPRGTYVYTYQIRASVPGEFQTMPSHAYAFYFPEVFGRTEGALFTVTQTAAEE